MEMEMEMEKLIIIVWRILGSVGAIGLIWFLVCLYNILWVKSGRLSRKLWKQGIRGPPPSFLYGNVAEMQKISLMAEISRKSSRHLRHQNFVAHDYTSTLFPYFEQWRKQYGSVYMYSTGIRKHLYLNRPDVVKEMSQCFTLSLGKPSYVTKALTPMLGNGILRSNGLLWAQQRKIVAPEFFMDKVKIMVEIMTESTLLMIEKWEDCLKSQGGFVAEIKVDEDLRGLSADVISRACFGSSYTKGKEIFSKLRCLQGAISKQSFLFGIPSISGFLMTKKRKWIKNLEAEIEELIWEAVLKRKQESSSPREKDLMQLLLEGAMNDENLDKESSKRFIVDNCKTIYFAGHESTSVAASWCFMLLALYPEWQARIRAELAQVNINSLSDANSLNRLKTMTMVIQETLRLYPPAAFVSREVLEETQIGDIIVPKGVYLWTLIPTLHRDPDIWGADANEFKPERFASGVSKACRIPQAYVPFGLGPRLCLGRNFAMVQLKVTLALVISKFTFSLAPTYQHSPAYKMIVEPEHGVRILIQKSNQ